MLKHNKKRNIGLLSEFFAKYIATAAVEFRYEDVEKAKNLWEKHVTKNKILSREFALFESLHKAHIKDGNVAYELLEKAKNVASKIEENKIEEAKTKFLHEINNTLKDDNFFSRPVEDFRTIATIQVLLNAWRTKTDSPNLVYASKLEDMVLEHIKTEKATLKPVNEALLNHTKEDIDKLVVNVFREKVDNKYSNILDEDQKKLLGWFIFSNNQPDAKKALVEELATLKNRAIKNIDLELKSGAKSGTKEKLLEAKNHLTSQAHDINNPNENTIVLYLAVCNLNKELESTK